MNQRTSSHTATGVNGQPDIKPVRPREVAQTGRVKHQREGSAPEPVTAHQSTTEAPSPGPSATRTN
jgi:hypothetical protein